MSKKEILIEPMFELGKVPRIPHCVLTHREYRGGKWHYFVQNNYNAYASGWADEDWIIKQISNQHPKQ